jgi:HAD superfamily hydrolase (TIGR01549 family)
MKAILLDWDGVLCDSVRLYYDLYVEACERWKKPFPVSDIQAFRGWYNPRWEENYYEMGFTHQEFEEMRAWSEVHLDYARAELFPGVAENLAGWAQVAPLAIVSTTPSPLIRARLGDLASHFMHFTGGEDGCSEKRQKVANTLRHLGVSAGVMVGDTPLDVDAGQFNGLATVGVTYGWVTPERVREARPSCLVESPEQLYQAVLQCL